MSRKRSSLLAILAINVGVTILIDSGMVIGAARLARDEFRRQFPISPYRIYRGGYEEPLVATWLLIPSLIAQAICVRVAIGIVARVLLSCATFRRTVWLRALYLGAPLILIVFVIDFATCIDEVYGYVWFFFCGTWFPLFTLFAIRHARMEVRSRAIGMNLICGRCANRLNNSDSACCPKCGQPRVRPKACA